MFLFILMLVGLAAAVFASFLCSGTETAYYRASPIRLRSLADGGDRDAVNVREQLKQLPRIVVDILVANNMTVFVGSYLLTSWLAHQRVPGADWWATLAVTPLFFLFGDMLPKRLACEIAEPWALRSWPSLKAARILLWPVSQPLNAFAAALRRLLRRGGAGGSGEDPRALVLAHFAAGAEAHALSPAQLAMSRRIMTLESLTARDFLVPLAVTPTLPADTPAPEAARALLARGHAATLLVDSNGRPTGDEVTLRMLWQLSGPDAARPDATRDAGRPVPRLRPEEPFADMLDVFRQSRTRLALVVDDRGKALGIVPVERILRRVLAGDAPKNASKTKTK